MTMNQSGTDSGQSMEDILASIRRIIAEGEQDAKGRCALGGRRGRQDAARQSAKSDVFELTQIVQDDGSIVTVGEEAQTAAPVAEVKPKQRQAIASASPVAESGRPLLREAGGITGSWPEPVAPRHPRQLRRHRLRST